MAAETGSGVQLMLVGEEWERFEEVLALDYEVLYRDFGVGPKTEYYRTGEAGVHAIALSDGALVGAARLLGAPGERDRQLRQLAVSVAWRGRGIGQALVEELETHACVTGTERVWLYARDTAYAFYERLGYEFCGETFVSELTGIPHRKMCRRLGDTR